MRAYQVEVTTRNQGEAPVRTECEVISKNGSHAILTAIELVRPADSMSVFCKSLPINKEKSA